MERKLNDAERLMQSGLLARICQKADAMQLDLESLDINLQHFLQQYQQGHRDTSDLISTEMFRTRSHVTQESQKATAQIQLIVDQQSAQLDQTIRNSNQQVSTAVEALSFARDREAKRRRFLRSFKFTGMNQRRNQVGESCEGTFEWIFTNEKGVLEDFDDESEYTSTESEGSERSGCSQDNSPDGTYGSAGQNGVAPQDGNTRWDSFIDWLKIWQLYLLVRWQTWLGKVHADEIHHIRPTNQKRAQRVESWGASGLALLLASRKSNATEHQGAPSGGHKDSDTDWSTGELQKLCFDAVEQYHRPICFFLDGLDEVSPDDGVVRLLEVIHGLGTIQNVKICVASRPEYLIEKNLDTAAIRPSVFKTLRVMIYEYTPRAIPSCHLYSRYLLVEKAEGVFLWLCLAIKSSNRGLNDDQPLYREKAVLYFGLVISGQRFNWPNTLSLKTSLNVFDVMLITTSMADRVLEEPSHIVQPSVLITACQRIESEVPLMYAGLLERKDSGALGLHREPYEERKPVEATLWDGEQYAALMPLIADLQTFQFIHRSAYDFLVDTPEGKEIMSHCRFSKSELQRQIICASVACCQLALIKVHVVGSPRYVWSSMVSRYIHCIGDKTTHESDRPDYQSKDWMVLIEACQRLSRSGRLLSFGDYPTNIFGRLSRMDFYSKAATYGLTEIALSAGGDIGCQPECLSKLLFNTCIYTTYPPWTLRSPHTQSNHLIARLLKQGADPNGRHIKSSGFGPPRFYGEISPEDSKLFCEPLVRRLLLGFPEFINDQSLRGFEVEGFGERLDDVLERSNSTKKTAQDHLIDLGLGEATVYVDDDGVRYPRDFAQKMTPEWMVGTLYRKPRNV
ncbi:hypothetical protein BDP81DRAFT_455670 [Colletotrichum phormii]|uniref:Vegetative incompatibility protein HET-E-1 n=1 Tax=Colletotrichum phormii TaxID=359342 RepID=A0AAJ0E811_9PEZI|nr:uncharacterized protein BDP81DRAFT_455670 [Colletotrichum phormii]KAK1622111.1 hypothetical protein BDP81DRAFT_455670 [Colletotrichum phormii]